MLNLITCLRWGIIHSSPEKQNQQEWEREENVGVTGGHIYLKKLGHMINSHIMKGMISLKSAGQLGGQRLRKELLFESKSQLLSEFLLAQERSVFVLLKPSNVNMSLPT